MTTTAFEKLRSDVTELELDLRPFAVWPDRYTRKDIKGNEEVFKVISKKILALFNSKEGLIEEIEMNHIKADPLAYAKYIERIGGVLEKEIGRSESWLTRTEYKDISHDPEEILVKTLDFIQYQVAGGVIPYPDLLLSYTATVIQIHEEVSEFLRELAPELEEEQEELDNIPSIESPRHKLVLLYELGILELIRNEYSYLNKQDLSRLICLITGITDPKKGQNLHKEIDDILYQREGTGKSGNPVNAQSAKTVINSLRDINVKIKKLKKFE